MLRPLHPPCLRNIPTKCRLSALGRTVVRGHRAFGCTVFPLARCLLRLPGAPLAYQPGSTPLPNEMAHLAHPHPRLQALVLLVLVAPACAGKANSASAGPQDKALCPGALTDL